MKTKTPELDKMQAVKEDSNIIGQFIDWLKGEGYTLCKYREEEYDAEFDTVWDAGFFPEYKSTDKLLAEYFEIDLDKAEDERRKLLDEIRSNNESN